MQRDRRRRGERRIRRRDARRQRHDEARRHRHDLGVAGVSLPDAGDEPPDREPRVATGVEHLAGAAVAERRVLVEPAAHLGGGRGESLASRRLDGLADEIRPRPRLLEQRLRTERGHRPLRAGRDERVPHGDERVARRRPRLRHLVHGDLARPDVLEDLLHAAAPYSRCHCSSTISDQTWSATSRRPARSSATRRPDRVGLEETPRLDLLARQVRADERRQLAVQPDAHRRIEADLPLRERASGQMRLAAAVRRTALVRPRWSFAEPGSEKTCSTSL